MQQNANVFGAGIYSAPFDDTTKTAINNWVKENTDGMIPEIIDKIPTDTVMYLVNALAFDAKWASVFQSSDVWDETFIARDGRKQTGAFLHGEVRQYLHDEHAEGFLKPYEGGRYAFAALLPDETTSIEDYVSRLTGEQLHAILTSPGG